MDDNRLLYDTFNIYYEQGLEALKNKQYEKATRNIFAASETLLKLAKKSSGVVKAQKIKRAEELCVLANGIKNRTEGEYNKNQTCFANEQHTSKTGGYSKTDDNDENELTSFIPVDKTGIQLDDVAGLEEVKDEIRRLIIEPKLYSDVYKKFKKNKGGGILLYGVPGTGKTMIAQAIANEIDACFYSIKCSDLVSKWFGDSEKNVKRLFSEAKEHTCSIIFFDEFEALGAKRDSSSTVMKRLVPELLSQMQGFEKNKNTLLLIAATNRPWDIDSAFLRPGRFNTSIYVPLPDEKAREQIILKNLDSVPLENNFDFEKTAKETDGFNCSDVVEFCEKLKDYAIQRNIIDKSESPILNEDIDKTFLRVKTSVNADDLSRIIDYKNKQK